MLVNGKWSGEWTPLNKDGGGAFIRKDSTFRNWVTPDGRPGPSGEGGFKAEPGRYRLYVALICPWASRTLIGRACKDLEAAIPVSVVNPVSTDQGWAFGGFPRATKDPELGAAHIHELYSAADPGFTGRATVPVLWDRERRTIVNNESADILRMLTTGFGPLGSDRIDLYPEPHRAAIDAFNDEIYGTLNNGVYRAGFATAQEAYAAACRDVFAMLDRVEQRLGTGPFLFGSSPTESDIRLFVTLIRFDAAYHGAFKCNLKRLADYPALSRFVEAMLRLPKVAATVDIDHIKRGYYGLQKINPTGIVPLGPELPFAPLLAAGDAPL